MKLRTVNDYVDVIKDKFPMLSKEEVKKILTYCWKMIYLYNSQGNDVLIKNDDLVFFIGKLTKNSLKNFQSLMVVLLLIKLVWFSFNLN